MNKAIMMGRVTKDIELVRTTGGTNYCRFTLAVQTGYGDNKKVHWFKMIAWQKTAEIMSDHVKKGAEILVESEPTMNSYTDKDGKKHENVEFRVITWEFTHGKAPDIPNLDEVKEEPKRKGRPPKNPPPQPKPAPAPSGPPIIPPPPEDPDWMSIPDNIDDELPFA